jgi:hypothetical protein
MLTPLVFDSPLLTSIVQAVERRGKAIRYQGTLVCERELDRGVERLNVDVTSTLRERLRLSVWSDGTFWLSVNKPKRAGRAGGRSTSRSKALWASGRLQRSSSVSSRVCFIPQMLPVSGHPKHLTRRWSERRTAVRSTFDMTSTLPLRTMCALVRRRSSCSR